jgi:hypothetical protein
MNPFSGYGSHGKRRGCFPTRPYQYMKLNEAECRYVAKNARHVAAPKRPRRKASARFSVSRSGNVIVSFLPKWDNGMSSLHRVA